MAIPSESPATITAQFLVNESAGGFRTNNPKTEPGWLVSTGQHPDTPDNAITLTEAPLYRDGDKLMNGDSVAKPMVQVRVRSLSRNDAYRKAAELFELLSHVRGEIVTVNEKQFELQNFSTTEPPVFMGNEPNTDRPNFTFDIYLTAKEL